MCNNIISMKLENVVIVLSRPDESRNVGAVCRAMANNGLKTLRIVGKREDFDDERVRILAIHAANIWENAEFFDSITQATKDCVTVAGTTRRRGKKRGHKLLLPNEFASLAADTTENSGKVAAVFGNERTGLTDPELLECNLGVTIPSDDGFPSLNLSHAVQIISYHLFIENSGKLSGYTPLTLERLEKTVDVIGSSLRGIGFFSRTTDHEMKRFWRNILSRAALSEGEAQYIEQTFVKAEGLSHKEKY